MIGVKEAIGVSPSFLIFAEDRIDSSSNRSERAGSASWSSRSGSRTITDTVGNWQGEGRRGRRFPRCDRAWVARSSCGSLPSIRSDKPLTRSWSTAVLEDGLCRDRRATDSQRETRCCRTFRSNSSFETELTLVSLSRLGRWFFDCKLDIHPTKQQSEIEQTQWNKTDFPSFLPSIERLDLSTET